MRFRLTVAVAVASAVTLGAAVMPAAATAPAPPGAGQIQSAESRASAIEAQIAADTRRAQVAGERFDEAGVALHVAEVRLARVRAALAVEAGRIALARSRVRSAAVAAYVVGDSAAAQFGEVLTSNIADVSTITTYSGVASTHLAFAVKALSIAEQHLRASESTESTAAGSARAAVLSAAAARGSAAAAAGASSSALARVKGHIAALVAAQEAAAAAAAEARARAAAAAAARERSARRAAALAAQQRAEAQAAAAASVAGAVASANPSNASLQAVATAASSAASSASAVGQAPLQPAGTNPAGLKAVQTAEQYLGVPYVWGGASNAGVDCSGLTMLAWASAGVALTHSAWYQYEESQHIALGQIEPGDLVFYWFPNDGTSQPVSHVAMYVGSGPFGAQTLIQAPETGQNVEYVSMYYYGLVGVARPGV